MTETFDKRHHRFPESRYFEDLAVGERFYIPSRTMTEAHFAAFQTLSADNHPIHYDVEYCRETEQSSKFLKPVYPGDTLYPKLEIAALTPQRSTGVVTLATTVHNQKGELVLCGEQKILPRKRGAGGD